MIKKNAEFKRELFKGEYKLRKSKRLAKFIKNKMKIDKWSPDAIVSYMKTHNFFERDGFEVITTPTIYNAIRYVIINVKLKGTRKMKNKVEYKYHNKTDLPESKAEYSINNRLKKSINVFNLDISRMILLWAL